MAIGVALHTVTLVCRCHSIAGSSKVLPISDVVLWVGANPRVEIVFAAWL